MTNGNPPSCSRPTSGEWFVTGVWALLTVNLILAVGLFQPNVLTWDQWDFFRPLFEYGSWWDMFRLQHGPHRQGLGFVLTAWIMKLTHWDSRIDSLWIACLLSIAVLLALRLKRVIAGRLRIWDAWIPVVGLTLTQFEVLLITPNASHSAFPLALIMAIANAWLSPQLCVRYLVAGIGTVCLVFTGFGLFAGGVLTVLLLAATVRHLIAGERASALLASLGFCAALGGWVLFRQGYVFAPAVENFRFPWDPVTDYFRFLALMLLQPAGVDACASFSHYLVGATLAAMIVGSGAFAAWHWLRTLRPSPNIEVVLFLLGSGLLFVCNTAVGRIPHGVTAGMASRYVTLMFPLWIGLYVTALLARWRPGPLLAGVVVWGIAIWPYRDLVGRPLACWPGSLGATNAQLHFFEWFTTNKAAWAETFLRTGKLDHELTVNHVYPWPGSTNLEGKLRFLRERHLSFFAHGSALPFLLRQRAIWDDQYPACDGPRMISGRTKLTFITNRSGLLELPITAASGGVLPPVEFAVETDAGIQHFALARLPGRVAIPVKPGFNKLVITPAPAGRASEPPPKFWIGPAGLRTVLPERPDAPAGSATLHSASDHVPPIALLSVGQTSP